MTRNSYHLSIVFICLLLSSSFFNLVKIANAADPQNVFALKSELQKPQNRRNILTIKNVDKLVKKYKIAELEKLPLYQTELPALYTGEDGSYQGVLLDELLKDAGISNYTKIRLSALDGYVIEFAHEPLKGKKGFIATRFKGNEMPVTQKGYVRLLLPSQVDWNNPKNTNTSIWIWNLTEIMVLE
jgi:hypothetical protein